MMSRREVWLVCRLGELIPGTVDLTIIAAEDPIADAFPQCRINTALMFYRQIGNTPSCVKLVGCNDGLGRTNIDAGRTSAAMICTIRFINRQRYIGKNFPEKKPRARISVEQQSIFTDPAQPGFLGKRLFKNGGAIGKYPTLEFR